MDPLTFEAVTRNPELIDTLVMQARRERAEAFYRLVVLPIKTLFTRAPEPGRTRHRLELGGVSGRPAQG